MTYHATIVSTEYGAGFVVVAGWLAVPHGTAWPDPVRLRVGSEVHTITHWFERPHSPWQSTLHQVLAFHEDLPWPHAGPPPEGVALGAPDGTILTAAGPTRWRAFAPLGHIDSAGQQGVRAWVFDPALWHTNATCALALDGVPRGPLHRSVVRTDLPFGAARRGVALGIELDASTLGKMLQGTRPFDEAPHRWSLLTSGVEVARLEHATPPSSRGRLEAHLDGQLRGWAALQNRPDLVVQVEVAVDGIRYASIPASRGRSDLRKQGISHVGGGFAVPLRFALDASGEARVEARVAGEARALRGAPLAVEGLRLPRGGGASSWRSLAQRRPGVAIVVPVFNAPEDLARCLEAVVTQTGGDARLIVLDDASTDPQVAEVLAAYRGRPGVEIHVNPENLGFTRTCNKGIAAADRDDVVLLNSDTIVPPRWLENLILAAHATPRTGSATPLSDNAGAFSAPEPGSNTPPAGLSGSDLSRLTAQASLATFPELPTGHGFCLYLRRDLLDAVGTLDETAFPRGYGEENDLCVRALRAGFRHALDDRTYVRHRQSASFGAEKATLLAAGRSVLEVRYPEYSQLVRDFLADEAIMGVRWRVRRAFAAGVAPRPRVLFVIATETGGTPQTNLDLMRALADRYEPWLLRSNGQELVLSRVEGGQLQQVERRVLDRPLSVALHASEEYDEAVADLLVRHAIELVHVRHLAWHGLGLPAVARALGIPVVLSLHDFYVVCPTVKLLDDSMAHCGGRCTPGAGECRAELWSAAQVPPLKHRFVHRWRDMMAPALAACDAFVTTSARAREIVVDAHPALQSRDFRLIAHGRSFTEFTCAATPRVPGEVVRVLVPGNISAAKGADILRAMAAADGGRRVEFHVLGEHGQLEAGPGLVLHGRYTREDMARRVAEIRPHLGAVLSIWPETYCHTLTELWASGLPVFALDLGAVGERLRTHGGGWLAESRDPAVLLAALLAAVADPEDVTRRVEAVKAWQQGVGTARDVDAMAVDYDLLYRELAHRRLTFVGDWSRPQVWLRVDARTAVAKPALPAAFANRADAPIVFRPAAAATVRAALEAGGVAGVALLTDEPSASTGATIAALCADHGVPLVLCADMPAAAGRPSTAPERGGVPPTVSVLVEPGTPPRVVWARIAELASARQGMTEAAPANGARRRSRRLRAA